MRRPIVPVPARLVACPLAGLLAGLLAAGALAWAPEARAGIFVGAELDGGRGIDVPAGTRLGYGFAAALGYRIGIGPVFVQPEAQGGYFVFPIEGSASAHVARALGGARFGLAGMIQPALYAHAGVGWLDAYTSGKALDAGAALAFAPFKRLKLLSFGAQAGYNVVIASGVTPVTRWVSFGAHAAIDF